MEATSTNGGGQTREYVVSRALEILRDEGPMHINDLHARFIDRGYDVPGAGAPVNLTVHIRRSNAIWSPSRGVYAIRDVEAPPPKPAVKRKPPKRRPRRRPKKART